MTSLFIMIDSLSETLSRNNYQSISSRNLDRTAEINTLKISTVCLSYVKVLVKKIQKICNPYDIQKCLISSKIFLSRQVQKENNMTKNCLSSIPCYTKENWKAEVPREIKKIGIGYIWKEKGNIWSLCDEVKMIYMSD